jgi:hypothetical protein
VLKFLVGMIQSNANNQNATSVLNTATLMANGTVAHLSLVVPEQLAEQLFMPGAAKPRMKKLMPAPAQ